MYGRRASRASARAVRGLCRNPWLRLLRCGPSADIQRRPTNTVVNAPSSVMAGVMCDLAYDTYSVSCATEYGAERFARSDGS